MFSPRPGEKICNRCRFAKSEEEFPFVKATMKPFGMCYDCTNYVRRRIAAIQRAFSPLPPRSGRWHGTNPVKAKILELLAQGLRDSKDIAKQGKCSESHVRFVAAEAGISLRKYSIWTPELIESVRSLLHSEEALNYRQIAARVNLTREQVAGAVFRYGLNDLQQRPAEFKAVNGNKLSRRDHPFSRVVARGGWITSRARHGQKTQTNSLYRGSHGGHGNTPGAEARPGGQGRRDGGHGGAGEAAAPAARVCQR